MEEAVFHGVKYIEADGMKVWASLPALRSTTL
jgi:hypothetical protein